MATAHEQPINFAGGTNTGYLLIDPETGSGAYLIASGASGGLLQFIGVLLAFTAAFALAIGIAFSGGLLAFGIGAAVFIWEVINFRSWVSSMANAQNYQQFSSNNFTAMMGALLGLVATLGTVAGIVFAYGAVMAFILGLI